MIWPRRQKNLPIADYPRVNDPGVFAAYQALKGIITVLDEDRFKIAPPCTAPTLVLPIRAYNIVRNHFLL